MLKYYLFTYLAIIQCFAVYVDQRDSSRTPFRKPIGLRLYIHIQCSQVFVVRKPKIAHFTGEWRFSNLMVKHRTLFRTIEQNAWSFGIWIRKIRPRKQTIHWTYVVYKIDFDNWQCRVTSFVASVGTAKNVMLELRRKFKGVWSDIV